MTTQFATQKIHTKTGLLVKIQTKIPYCTLRKILGKSLMLLKVHAKREREKNHINMCINFHAGILLFPQNIKYAESN